MRPTPQAYDELQRAYSHFNGVLYSSALPDCLITLQRKKRTQGYFSPNRFVGRDGKRVHEIAMNPSYFAVVPLETTLGTLVHEMAHVWQYEQGKPGRRGYHNREWAEHMKAIGLYPSSTGRPGGAETGEHMADYIVEGGPFIVACRELLAGDFTLSWYDRLLPRLVDDPGAAPGGLAGADAEGEEPEDPEGEGAPSSVAPGGTGGPALAAPLTVPPAALEAANFELPQSGTRSTRSKYECPRCQARVWGKPGLGITCTACEVAFEEV